MLTCALPCCAMLAAAWSRLTASTASRRSAGSCCASSAGSAWAQRYSATTATRCVVCSSMCMASAAGRRKLRCECIRLGMVPMCMGPCPKSPARRCCVPRLLGFTMPSSSCEIGTKVTAVVPNSAGSLPMPHHGARAGSVGCSQHISCPGVGVVSVGVPPAVCAPCWAAHGDGRACCAQRPPAAHHLLPQALQATAGHVR